MKKKKRLIAGLLACVMLLSILPAMVLVINSKEGKVSAATCSDDGKFTIPQKDGELGTDNNPFVVLEIVPNASMASFGYLVKGQEPINIEEAFTKEQGLETVLGSYLRNNSKSIDDIEFRSMIGEDTGYEVETLAANHFGTFVLDQDNGNYKLTMTKSPKTGMFKNVGAGKGSYDLVINYYEHASSYKNNTEYFEVSSAQLGSHRKENGVTYYTGDYSKDASNNYIFSPGEAQNEKYNVEFKKIAIKNKWRFKNNLYTELPINYEYYKEVGANKGSYAPEYQCIYTLTKLADGEARDKNNPNVKYFTFKGLDYKQSSMLDKKGESAQYTVYPGTSIDNDESYIDSTEIKGYIKDDVMVKYKTEADKYGNTELFKKYALGLAYKNNDIAQGEEVYSYDFAGWYYDKQCVNKFDESKRLTRNTAIYAKWITSYSSGPEESHTVTFNSNAGSDTIIGMSSTDSNVLTKGITNIPKDTNIVSPIDIPKRANYVFTGWYTDAACKTAFNYDTKISSDITLYAGWKNITLDIYKINFNANTGNEDQDTTINVPSTIGDYRQNGLTSSLQEVAISDPVWEGHSFAGWFYNKACTKAFAFGETLPDGISDNEITLYAKWVADGTPTYTITLNGNEPSSAIAKAEIASNKIISAKESCKIEPGIVPNIAPKLSGNITTKLNKYNVKVITVTPDDINGLEGNAPNNRGLIDRANLIVMNQTVNDPLVELWKKYKNTDIFNKTKYKDYSNYVTKLGTGGNTDKNDLDWSTVEKIWRKVSVGSVGNGSDVCPIIYDYSFYKDAARSDSDNNFTVCTSDGTKSLNFTKASNKNVYKLFLLTQQMNPVTMYYSYSKKTTWGSGYINNGSLVSWNVKTKQDISRTDQWNEKTLVPYEAMLSADCDDINSVRFANMLQVLGFDVDPSTNNSIVNYRSLVANNADCENILAGFVNKTMVVADDEMTSFMTDKKVDGTAGYSMTDALYYLLHSSITTSNIDRDLNILEIEPSDNAAAFKSEAYWHWYMSKYVSNFSGDINVHTTSSVEFVGNVADINADYDAIFIGVNNTGLKDDMKNTLSGDYRYMHTGKVVGGVSEDDCGSLDDADSKIRDFAFSGNDLTKVKMNDLLEYALSGYPIVFSRDVLTDSAPIAYADINSNKINTSYIDKSSYVYSLVYKLMNDKKADGRNLYDGSIFFENQFNSKSQDKKFRNAITTKKFSINLAKPAPEYKDRTVPEYKNLSDSEVYINGNDINDKNLKFSLKINSTNDDPFAVKVYIDTNADGKYTKEEQLDSLEIFDETLNKYVRYNKLVKAHQYKIVREIDEYVGAIPWKLEVYDTVNPGAICNETGQCAIRVAEKTKLKVLQINAEVDDTTDWLDNSIEWDCNPTVYLPTMSEINKARSEMGMGEITEGNMDKYFNGVINPVVRNNDTTRIENIIKNSGRFYYYLSQLNEFDVEIERMTVKEYINSMNAWQANPDTKNMNYFREKGINMITIGFADCFTDIATKDASGKLAAATNCLDAIKNFISDGNAVLFTHDTTSHVNVPKEKYKGFKWWGYNINRYFREMLGMDRYDVMYNKGTPEKINDSDSKANDWMYSNGSLQESKDYVKSSKKVLNQGMTNFIVAGNSGGSMTTAVRANEGQLVSYPYELPEDLKVAPTHPQYYQLNLEDNDTVVWYTLQSGDKTCSIKNDVRNNYYIYNKGNITYSGVGHDPNMTNDEVKLFVNTMVAAYNATTQPTVPVITNSDKSTDNADTDFLYVDYDATVSTDSAQPFGEGVNKETLDNPTAAGKVDTVTKRTYFTLKNNSIVINKRMTVHYFPFIVNDAGEKVVLENYELPLETNIYDEETKQSEGVVTDKEDVLFDGKTYHGALVESNMNYYVDVPISDIYYSGIQYQDLKTGEYKIFKALDKQNKFGVQIQVIMRYGKDLTANEPLLGIRNAFFMRRGMFALD